MNQFSIARMLEFRKTLKMEQSHALDVAQAKVLFNQELEATYRRWLEHRDQWLAHKPTSFGRLGVTHPDEDHHLRGFWRGVSSFSIWPRTNPARWIRAVPANSAYESLYQDWLAVGSDLFAALRQDTILHQTSGDRTSDTAEPATTTAR